MNLLNASTKIVSFQRWLLMVIWTCADNIRRKRCIYTLFGRVVVIWRTEMCVFSVFKEIFVLCLYIKNKSTSLMINKMLRAWRHVHFIDRNQSLCLHLFGMS